MSKRVTITLDDEHFAVLQQIAKQNGLSVSASVYTMMDEWMHTKALQFQLQDELMAMALDAAATGTPN